MPLQNLPKSRNRESQRNSSLRAMNGGKTTEGCFHQLSTKTSVWVTPSSRWASCDGNHTSISGGGQNQRDWGGGRGLCRNIWEGGMEGNGYLWWCEDLDSRKFMKTQKRQNRIRTILNQILSPPDLNCLVPPTEYFWLTDCQKETEPKITQVRRDMWRTETSPGNGFVADGLVHSIDDQIRGRFATRAPDVAAERTYYSPAPPTLEFAGRVEVSRVVCVCISKCMQKRKSKIFVSACRWVACCVFTRERQPKQEIDSGRFFCVKVNLHSFFPDKCRGIFKCDKPTIMCLGETLLDDVKEEIIQWVREWRRRFHQVSKQTEFVPGSKKNK